MRSSFLASALFSSLLASSLVACGGGDDGGFAGANAEDRGVAVAAATGELASGAADLALLLGVAALEGGSQCPKATLSGTDLTVTGDCTADDGEDALALRGSFVIRGFGAGGDGEPIATALELRGFGFGGDDDGITFDGRIAVEPSAGGELIDQDLTLEGVEDGDDRSVSVKGRLSCNEDGNCTPVGDYTVDVDSIGAARVTGTWNTGTDPRAGSITLTADDAFAVDFTRPDARGCYPTTVDGKASDALCIDVEDEEEPFLRALNAAALR
jgi:hypothetical protein